MGTLTLTYNGTPGGVATTLTASATISDADATTIVAWGEAMIAAKQQPFRRGGVASPPPPAPTPQDVFTLLVTQWISQVVSTVTSWNQQQALQKITSTATLPAPIQITPNS